MIESIKTGNYEVYGAIKNVAPVNGKNKVEVETSTFDIKDLLGTLKNYNYTEKDIDSMPTEVVEGLKNKFDITKEDIYKLKKNGYDLEKLYIEDTSFSQMSLAPYKENETEGAKVKQVAEKVETIKKKNDTMYLYSLNQNTPITINSLYQSNFKGNFKKTNTNYTSQDVTGVLNLNGLSATNGNKWAASMLMEYGMEVNKESVTQLQNMESAIDSLDKQEEMKKAQEDIEGGNEPGERPLIENNKVLYDTSDIKNIKDDLGKVEDQKIEELVASDEEITIGSLRATLFKNTELALKEHEVPTLNEGQKESVEKVKDQISQIRAKLTNEAAQKVSEKMPLESSKLSEVVQELNAVQEELVENVLQEAELPLTEENKQIVTGVMTLRQQMLEHPQEAVGVEISTDEKAQLNEIQVALNKYYENETPVEKRFGEGIHKVEDQIEQILAGQNIEVTEETIQAAKALITNGLEVNLESVDKVKEIVLKMNTFLEEMTPSRTATLIKEGVNPYTSTVDHLLEWISKEKIDVLKGSIAESIVALEEKGLLSTEQKETLLGFYRIMKSVNKNREEVVGYLFKNDSVVTMQKLQEATKYIGQKGVIEVAVDDRFGEIESLKYEVQTAKKMIEENKEVIDKTVDVVKMLENMQLPITEENIDKLKKINALLYPIIKEQFKKELGKFEGMSTLPTSFLEKLETVKNVESDLVKEMIEKKIPLTVSNIYWTQKLTERPELYKELLEEGGLIKKELPKSFEETKENLEGQEEEVVAGKETAIQNGDMLKYKVYKQIEEMTDLQKEFSDKSGLYQIPFLINGESKMVHMYFNKNERSSQDSQDISKVVMSYETKHLGVITTYIEYKEDSIDYKMKGETAEITHKLQQSDKELVSLLLGVGYAVGKSEYKVEEASSNDNIVKAAIKKGDSQFEEIV